MLTSTLKEEKILKDSGRSTVSFKIEIYFAREIIAHGHLEPVPDMETRLTKNNAWVSLAFSYFYRLLL